MPLSPTSRPRLKSVSENTSWSPSDGPDVPRSTNSDCFSIATRRSGDFALPSAAAPAAPTPPNATAVSAAADTRTMERMPFLLSVPASARDDPAPARRPEGPDGTLTLRRIHANHPLERRSSGAVGEPTAGALRYLPDGLAGRDRLRRRLRRA